MTENLILDTEKSFEKFETKNKQNLSAENIKKKKRAKNEKITKKKSKRTRTGKIESGKKFVEEELELVNCACKMVVSCLKVVDSARKFLIFSYN